MAKEKILVVDDEKAINKLVCSYLTKEQFRPLPAYNGEEALDLLKKENPDLIILDIMLPDTEGTALSLDIREYSNGESAFLYFSEKITENALFLLDEPENSLSPVKQQELVRFLENAVRFFGCQFVISTHSPFLLSMKGARIYDLDEDPVDVKKWTQLENVRAYYQFFKEHEDEFTAW